MSTRRTHRLSFADLARTAWLGAAGRPQRTALAALGIALGIASLVALTGVAASNRAQLLADLDAMGADLVVVTPATGPDQQPVPLPDAAPATIARQHGVDRIGVFETPPPGLAVYRNDLVPETETNGLAVAVARPDVLGAVEAQVVSGRWFDDATRALPVAVLGSVAAERLGIERAGDRVLIGGEWYGVLGILAPAGLAADVDTSAVIGDRWVRRHFTGDEIGRIAAIFVRAAPGVVGAVRDVVAVAASPGSPYVAVSERSDLAEARGATDDSLTTLGVTMAGIALLVGGVGIANTMVVTVLERRGEIGLRRALGARPGQVAAQFVAESMLLALIGGVAGLGLGAGAAAVLAVLSGQPLAVPPIVIVGGPALAIVVGAIAGLRPAIRAARLSPTAALRSS